MFEAFPKIARLSREVVITEKLDGTNAQVHVVDLSREERALPGGFVFAEDGGKEYAVFAGSRNRYIGIYDDNFGFAKWVHDNAHELVKLGPGRHFGEWYGLGIQRGYGLNERRFALFNVSRWADDAARPSCCHVVPTLHRGEFSTSTVAAVLSALAEHGSVAVPGFTNPEGVIIYHTHANVLFKKTLEGDGKGKGHGA